MKRFIMVAHYVLFVGLIIYDSAMFENVDVLYRCLSMVLRITTEPKRQAFCVCLHFFEHESMGPFINYVRYCARIQIQY